MVRTTFTISIMLLMGPSVQSQMQTASTVQAPEATVLVSSVAPATNDSPLVQAARRAVAARQRTTIKIDNASVLQAKKLLTTTDNQRTIPTLPPAPQASPQRSVSAISDRAGAKKKTDEARPAVRRPMDDAEELYPENNEVPQMPPSPKPAAKPPQ